MFQIALSKRSVVAMLRLVWLITAMIHGTDGIMGGYYANKDQFKYVASIWKDFHPACGGGIISEYHILTAGHCGYGFSEAQLKVIVGRTSFDDEPINYLAVARIIVHPNFAEIPNVEHPSITYAVNDVAVLKLSQALQWNSYVQPVPWMKTPSISFCSPCMLAGWGTVHPGSLMSADLKWTIVYILRREVCLGRNIILTQNEMCAYDPRGNRPGDGDSGGLLVCTGTAVGIYSGESRSGDSIHSMTYAFSSFISDSIEGRI